MSYDINLKKTQLGYQFDRNVYIGYQTNDNRVVTVKELKGLNVSGGGGGGGGGIQSITLSGSGGKVQLTVDGAEQTATVTNVVADDTIPSGTDPKICVIAKSGELYTVYQTNKKWSDYQTVTLGQDDDNILITVATVSSTKQLTLGTGLTKSVSGTTLTLSLSSTVITGLQVSGQKLEYQNVGNGNAWTTLGNIGNVYAASGTPSSIINDSNTQFIFVEVD